METKYGGGHRIKVNKNTYKISIALIVILAFCLSFILPDKSAWAANSSLSFDGNTYVSVPSNDTLQPTTQITIEAWAFAEPWESYRTIVTKGYDGYDGVYSLRMERTRSGNKVAFEVRTTSGWKYLYTPQGMPSNEWFHIAGVYDGSQMFLYINGILEASLLHTGTLVTNNIDVEIGRNSKEENWHGNIDEVRIWNVARTQEEIQQNMKHELSGNEPGLVAYWNMNEGTGSEVIDLAGNNNGTIYGTINWQDGAPVSALSAPEAPKNYDAVFVSSNVDLTWQANTEEDLAGYRVYRDNVKIADVEKTSTSYTDNTVLLGTTYTYEITAYNTSNQESAKSSPVTVTVPPGMPTEVTAQATGKEVSLSWQGPGNQQFIVERSSDGSNFTRVAEVTETSFTETAPLWDTTYYYRVAQKGQDSTVSAFSEAVQVTTGVLPVPPNLQASVSYNNITLTWDSVDGADAYIIQRSMDEGATWDDVDEVTQTTYTDDGLGWNLTFSYRIAAKSGEKVSGPSAAVSATTDNVSVPTELTASLEGNDVTLTWQAAPYVNLYLIERSTDGQTWEFLVEVAFATTYVDMALDLNSDYYYRVKSDGGNQISDTSNIVKVTAPPAAPTNMSSSIDGKEVTLSWEGQESMIFIVERSTDGQTWGKVAEVDIKTSIDTVPRWDTTYYYRVISKNGDGMVSEPSEVIQIKTPEIPAPTGLNVKVSENTVALTWDSITGISTYKIERSQNGILWRDLTELNTTSYQDQNLNWETRYYYRVCSLDGDQVSKPSETVSAQIPTAPVPEAPRITYIVDNTNVDLSWNYQRNCDGYNVNINGNLAAELPIDKTNYSFTGERGKDYLVKIEAYNAWGKASSSVKISISQMPTPGAGTMAGDIIKYTGVATASMGGLLALGLALKGSGGVLGVFRLFFR